MKYDQKDADITHLLKKLREANGMYPPEMLASRRRRYLDQVEEISSAAGCDFVCRSRCRYLLVSGQNGAGVPARYELAQGEGSFQAYGTPTSSGGNKIDTQTSYQRNSDNTACRCRLRWSQF